MQCAKCRTEVAASAPACPKCGAPVPLPPAGARLVITKAPDGSGQIGGFGRTMMDLGPSGAPTQVIFAIAKPLMVIGRAEDSDVQLNHATVSKQHVRVVWRDGAFWAEDMGSVNGIKVNDKEVEKHRLSTNDQIKVGKYVLTFLAPGAGA